MRREDIEKIVRQHASQLKEIGWTAVPLSNSKEDIGLVVKYDKDIQFNYYYDDNAEIYKVSATINPPQEDYCKLARKSINLLWWTSADTSTITKFYNELVDDIMSEYEYQPQQLYGTTKIVVELLGKTKQNALGAVKLMSEIFGDEADGLAERMLTNDEYIEFLKWKNNTKTGKN